MQRKYNRRFANYTVLANIILPKKTKHGVSLYLLTKSKRTPGDRIQATGTHFVPAGQPPIAQNRMGS